MPVVIPVDAPRGTVTLMFTDVEGATMRWERYAQRFGEALRIHEEIVRAAASRQDGYEVKYSQDRFMIAFSSAVQALQCAADIQSELSKAASQHALLAEVEGIRLRIGIHTGSPTFRDNDYFGPPVNRAARICDAGHGGMVLVSQEACRQAGANLPDGLTVEDCGLHRLKDLGQPERLFLLRYPGQESGSARGLRTLEALPHNFPAQITSFVGRNREQADLTRILHARRARLITLTGSGGNGKTRLAMQVAANCLQDFPDGVWLVELAGIRDCEDVPYSIIMALGIPLTASLDPLRQIIEFMRNRQCLLLLDNFEQVTEASPMVSDLLRHCPRLTCLVTSRELLHLSGEVEYPVEPLTVPAADGSVLPWTDYESIQLFLERCQAARPDFVLTDEAAPIIGDICRRLDGIPLAIELAAARVRGMTPLQVSQRLSHRFDLLASGQRDLPERQRTLRKAIDWSYDLLTEDERALFAELAIFSGGFTLEAAESVCITPGAFDLIFSLRDKSLIKADEVNGLTRYAMLETLREYALEKLKSGDSDTMLRDRYAAWFVALAERLNTELGGSALEAGEALSALTLDLDNIRAGMDWVVGRDEKEMTVAYGKALARFLLRRGLYRECDDRLQSAEQAAREIGDRTSLARLLNQRGLVAWERFDLDHARALFDESYAISCELEDRPRMLVTLINLGNIAWGHSSYDVARRVWVEALQLAIETGQRRYEAMLRMNLGILAGLRGDEEAEAAFFADSLAIHTREQDEEGIAFVLYNSSELHRRQQHYDQALENIERSRRLFSRLGHRRGIALTAVRLSQNRLESGLLVESRAPAEEGLRIAQETGDRACEMYALDMLARIAGMSGAFPDACALFLRSFAIAQEVRDGRHQADVLLHAGEAQYHHGMAEAAFGLLVVAGREYARQGLSLDREKAEMVERLRTTLDPAALQSLESQARDCSPETALSLWLPSVG